MCVGVLCATREAVGGCDGMYVHVVCCVCTVYIDWYMSVTVLSSICTLHIVVSHMSRVLECQILGCKQHQKSYESTFPMPYSCDP